MADSLSELNKAVARDDPQAVLEAVTGLVGQRIEYASEVEQATNYIAQAELAQELMFWVNHESSRGVINANEHEAVRRALEDILR